MGNKKDLQVLLDHLQSHLEKARFLQNSVKRVLTTKKDTEQTQQEEALNKQLETFSDDLQNLQEKINTVKSESDGEVSDNHERRGEEKKQAGQEKRHAMQPEDQENAYQLKALMMPQIYSQNKGLQAELALFHRRNDLRSQRKDRQVSYNKETSLSVATTLHILNMHDKRAREAERKAEALQAELDSRDGKEGQGNSGASAGKSRGAGERPQSHLPQFKVDEMMKRNQILSDENQEQRREIQRLKKANADYVLKVKHSASDRDLVMSQLSTSEMAKRDLSARLQRQKAQHDRLARSLTRQSSDWIESRKLRDQEEEELRWRQVGHAAPHGAQTRTFSHAAPRNVDQPRNMFPVKDYAQPVAT